MMPRRARNGTFEDRIRAFARRNPDFRNRLSDIEIAQMFAVSRQRVHQVLGPYRGPRRKPRRAERATSVATRLRELEAVEPHFRSEYTLRELAAKFGVSPQHIQQVIGPLQRHSGTLSMARARARLLALIQAQPAAVLPRHDGGMSLRMIREAASISAFQLRRLWIELKLPIRDSTGPGVRRVLRQEVCVECGSSFDRTLQHEYNYRNGTKHYVACSVRCGTRYGRRRSPQQREAQQTDPPARHPPPGDDRWKSRQVTARR